MQTQHNNTSGIERDQQHKSNATAWLCALLLAGIAALTAIFSFYLTATLRWDGPFRDLWEFVPFIQRQLDGEWSWSYLLDAYGGAHRIFLPKLLFYLDYHWLDGRNALTTAVALLCQCGYLYLLWQVLRQQRSLDNSIRLLLMAGFVLALFSTTQVTNFLYAMDVQWHMSNLLGLATLVLLTRGATPMAVIACGIAAALCNFTGLMALPVAALWWLTQPYCWRRKLLLFCSCLLLCLLYMDRSKTAQQFIISALHTADNFSWRMAIITNTASDMFSYTLRYLASPLSRQWPTAGYVLSFCALMLLGAYWRKLSRRELSVWQQLCLCIATYIALSAINTSFGRILYINSATTERYQTLVLPFLPALAGMVLPDVIRHRALACTSWLALWCWTMLPAQLEGARNLADLSNRVNVSHTAARAGVLAMDYVRNSLSYPLIKNGINSVKDNDTFLRSQHLGYFHYLPAYSLDTRPADPGALPACMGNAIPTLDQTNAAWVIEGQLLHEQQPVADLIILQNDQVVGLGTLLRPPGHLMPLHWQEPDSSRFKAFVRADKLQTALDVQLLGLVDSKPACELTLPTNY